MKTTPVTPKPCDNHFIWIDGNYIPKADAKIAALSQTMQYGFGVYEGIRSYQTAQSPAIFRLNDHTDRLFQSADLLKITIPYSKKIINQTLCDIIQQNKLENAYLRPMIFMGDEFLGLHTQKSSVHVMIAAIAWNNFYLSREQIKKGISLKTSSYTRLPLKNNLHKAKANGLYLISILANNEAQEANCQEALMLDPHGFVAEGSGANIFLVKNNQLFTPHCDFALDGITRKTIMEIAQQNNISVTEKNITLDELYQADEVFFTGTAAEVLAVTQIDGRIIAKGEMGPITEKFQKNYNDIVSGKMEQYQAWLCYT